jgi:hypothetical protein
MMMGLTFDGARTQPKRCTLLPLGARPTRDGPSSGLDGVSRRSPVAARVAERHRRAVANPATPPRPARDWRAGSLGMQRIEATFAALAFVGLLALGTLTFGYALDLKGVHTTGAIAVAGK